MRTLLILGLLVFVVTGVPATGYCTFVDANLNYSEALQQHNIVLVVRWESCTEPEAIPRTVCVDSSTNDRGRTNFTVVDVLKGDARRWRSGVKIACSFHQPCEADGLFFLCGDRLNAFDSGPHEISEAAGLIVSAAVGTEPDWHSPRPLTWACYRYIQDNVASNSPPRHRLRYLLAHLESADTYIAEDAFLECTRIRFEEWRSLAKVLPRKKLRHWIQDYETNRERVGLYGELLGLCGNSDDREFLQEMVSQSYLGSDSGILSGYLLLAGDQGLSVIEESRIKRTDVKELPNEIELYAIIEALEFMRNYGDGKIAQQRLTQTMLLLLDHKDTSGTVLFRLAWWKEWSVRNRIMKRYGKKGFDDPSNKRAIIRYLLHCAHDKTLDRDGNVGQHVLDARAHLKQLREDDPETVRITERLSPLH